MTARVDTFNNCAGDRAAMSRLSVLVVACVLGLGARAQVNREIDRSEDLLAVDSFDNEVSFCILYSLHCHS